MYFILFLVITIEINITKDNKKSINKFIYTYFFKIVKYSKLTFLLL